MKTKLRVTNHKMTLNSKASAEAAMKRVSHQLFNSSSNFNLSFGFLGKRSKAEENKRKREEGERNEIKD